MCGLPIWGDAPVQLVELDIYRTGLQLHNTLETRPCSRVKVQGTAQ